MATKATTKKATTKKKATVKADKKTGVVKTPLKFTASEVEQSGHKVYVFKAKASVLYAALSINRKIEGGTKDEGYQRVLSPSRVQAITRHIAQKRPIPTAIIVSFDSATFNASKNQLHVPKGTDVGWVIDGQHRLAGAEMASRAGVNIEMPVVAFIGLTPDRQVEQFVTINREAKNVPTSLYLDLLGRLPNKNPAEAARERAVDLATELRRNEDSPFFERIVVTVAPKEGQLSLTNFVRKVFPHVAQDKGILGVFSEREQVAVVSNYYQGLRQVFQKEFDNKNSMFFKTLGFGALWNVFPTFFSLALRNHKGFEVKDVVAIFKRIESFDFSAWKEFGSGNQAETLAGEDLKTTLLLAFTSDEGTSGSLRV
jgi:DGQHR domain-containing protein